MRQVILAFVIITSLLIVGCSAATPPTQTQSNLKPVEVQISLSEFAIDASLKNFRAGVPYHFVITNNGSINHEFMISPQMIGHNMNMGDSMSMEQMDKMAVGMIEESDLPPGATKTLDVTFNQANHAMPLELACWVKGHHEAGMYLPIGVN